MASSMLSLSLGSIALASSPYSRSPFRIEQCKSAIELGRRLLSQDAANLRGNLILAEGLLCRGLQGDDWALEDSIRILRRIVDDDRQNFFAALDLANALHERYPYSVDTENAFRGLRELIDEADVGAARQDLVEYIDTSLTAVQGARLRAERRLSRMATALNGASASSDKIGEFLLQLSYTGEKGTKQAIELLDVALPRTDDDPSALYYRAQILRGRVPVEAVTSLYAEVSAFAASRNSQRISPKIAELAALRLQACVSKSWCRTRMFGNP